MPHIERRSGKRVYSAFKIADAYLVTAHVFVGRNDDLFAFIFVAERLYGKLVAQHFVKALFERGTVHCGRIIALQDLIRPVCRTDHGVCAAAFRSAASAQCKYRTQQTGNCRFRYFFHYTFPLF